MSRNVQSILTGILTGHYPCSLSTREWRDLILVARANSLLPRVAAFILNDVKCNLQVPTNVNAHLIASIRHETLFHNQVKDEVNFVNAKISRALNRNLIVLIFMDSWFNSKTVATLNLKSHSLLKCIKL